MEAMALSIGLRQEVLTEIRNGMSLGDVSRKCELSLAAVCGIVQINITETTVTDLRSRSV